MFDSTTLTLRETQEFRKITGLPLAMMSEAGSNPDVDVMMVAGALYYIINRRTDPDLDWETVLDLPLNVLMEEFGDLDEEDDIPFDSEPGGG